MRNNKFNEKTATPIGNVRQAYVLRTSDVINVRIKTMDLESSSYFNMLSEQSVFNFNSAGLYLNSHSIDKEGTIEMPGAGKIKIEGLTLEEAQEKIQTGLADYLKNATVYVKLVSFKVSVLGEVQNPGYYYIYNEGATLLEGIALAGDLKEYGNREHLTLIRQTGEGEEGIIINLNNASFLSSPYYYLQPNDVIYVQPMRVKQTRANVNTLSVLGILFSGISAAILILQYTK